MLEVSPLHGGAQGAELDGPLSSEPPHVVQLHINEAVIVASLFQVRAQAERPQNRFGSTSLPISGCCGVPRRQQLTTAGQPPWTSAVSCVPRWLLRWLADPAKIKGLAWLLGQPDHVGLWAISGPLLGSFVFFILFKY
jgi:hypothetical protein